MNCHRLATEELWQELIKLMEENERTRKALETGNKDLSDKIGKLENDLERTRKALEIATHRLNQIAQHDCDQGCMYVAQNAIEEITALEKSELENLEMLVNNVFK